jgi:hypothetical protein
VGDARDDGGRENGLAITALVVTLQSVGGGGASFAQPTGYAGPAGLNDGGRPITNLYVYDQSGKLLDGVYVFDQSGAPVLIDHEDNGVSVTAGYVDADGTFVTNRFPERQARIVYGDDGAQHLVAVHPPLVSVPQGVHAAGPDAIGGPVPPDAASTVPSASAASSAATASPAAPSSGAAPSAVAPSSAVSVQSSPASSPSGAPPSKSGS